MIATKLIFVVLYSDWQALVIMFFEPNIFWERNMVTCDLTMAPAFCGVNLVLNICRCGAAQYDHCTMM